MQTDGKRLNEFLARFIVESDAIELITDDPVLVKNQLDKKSAEGHVGAILMMEVLAEKKQLLTEEIVCKVQGLITAEQHTKPGGPILKPEYIGIYRNCDVFISGRRCSRPIEVSDLMFEWIWNVKDWLVDTEYQTNASKLNRIARFHFEYERIHPFADGNGRSGRALVYFMMRHCGLAPFVFTSSDRFETYYNCFGDPMAMCRYFTNAFQDEEKVFN